MSAARREWFLRLIALTIVLVLIVAVCGMLAHPIEERARCHEWVTFYHHNQTAPHTECVRWEPVGNHE